MEHLNWVIILSDMAESGVPPLRKIPIIYRLKEKEADRDVALIGQGNAH